MMDRYIRISTAGIEDALYEVMATGNSIGEEFGRVCSDFTYDKDPQLVYSHLLGAIKVAIEQTDFTIEDAMIRVADNRIRAHAKHGDNSIESKAGTDTLFWLACLGEEYGELCEAELISRARYVDEILDFITVATAWAGALGRDH